MKIAASELNLESQRTALTRHESNERLRAWRGERPNFEIQESSGAIARISEAARQALAAAVPQQPTLRNCPEADAIDVACEAAEQDPFVVLVKRILEALTGRQVRVFDMQEFGGTVREIAIRTDTATAASVTAPTRPDWGLEYDYRAVHEEYERISFSASGTIRTADGQEISFSLELAMERHYREETNLSLRAGNAVRKDPLVVNFGGTAAQLAAAAGRSFRFDLDGDGKEEILPLFASGSGYLALDLNGNGRIDSGRELFGPASGNGFADLARLDDDGNGWIDEGDAAFSRLAVWTPAAEGAGTLRRLGALGIGALALAHAATPYALRSDGNADLGMVKSTGLWLGEDGRSGSLQEIDLTV